jgi:hypothetical protein
MKEIKQASGCADIFDYVHYVDLVLGYDTVPSGKQFVMFRRNVVLSLTGVKRDSTFL